MWIGQAASKVMALALGFQVMAYASSSKYVINMLVTCVLTALTARRSELVGSTNSIVYNMGLTINLLMSAVDVQRGIFTPGDALLFHILFTRVNIRSLF